MSIFSMPASLGLLGGGSAASVLGSALSAGSGNRAGRQARDWYDKQTASGMARTGRFYFGPEADSYIYDSLGLYDRTGGKGDALLNAQGGSISSRLRQLIEATTQRQTGNLAYYDQESKRLAGLERDALASYDTGGGRVMSQAMRGEDLARAWGQGREKIIEQDAGRQLRSADDTSKAMLAAAGLSNSTAMAQALQGNREAVGRNRDRAMQDLADSQIDRQRGAASDTLRASLQLDTGRNSAQQLALNRTYGRADGRMQLENQNLTRDIGMRQGELDQALQVLQSPQLNPWLGQDTSRYYPGSSVLGSALQTAGSGASALGSYGMGQNATLQLLRYLEASGNPQSYMGPII